MVWKEILVVLLFVFCESQAETDQASSIRVNVRTIDTNEQTSKRDLEQIQAPAKKIFKSSDGPLITNEDDLALHRVKRFEVVQVVDDPVVLENVERESMVIDAPNGPIRRRRAAPGSENVALRRVKRVADEDVPLERVKRVELDEGDVPLERFKRVEVDDIETPLKRKRRSAEESDVPLERVKRVELDRYELQLKRARRNIDKSDEPLERVKRVELDDSEIPLKRVKRSESGETEKPLMRVKRVELGDSELPLKRVKRDLGESEVPLERVKRVELDDLAVPLKRVKRNELDESDKILERAKRVELDEGETMFKSSKRDANAPINAPLHRAKRMDLDSVDDMVNHRVKRDLERTADAGIQGVQDEINAFGDNEVHDLSENLLTLRQQKRALRKQEVAEMMREKLDHEMKMRRRRSNKKELLRQTGQQIADVSE